MKIAENETTQKKIPYKGHYEQMYLVTFTAIYNQ